MELQDAARERSDATVAYARQAQRLGFREPRAHEVDGVADEAVEAKFITGQDPVIVTTDHERLPAVPVAEAVKLNELKDRAQGRSPGHRIPAPVEQRVGADGTLHGLRAVQNSSEKADAPLRDAVPQSKTNPLFPPMPMYGPRTLLRDLQCYFFRFTSAILSFCFLLAIVLGTIYRGLQRGFRRLGRRLAGHSEESKRPFHQEEEDRRRRRRDAEELWKTKVSRRRRRLSGPPMNGEDGEEHQEGTPLTPLEGGPDPLSTDPAYYARREGLDMETFEVLTEDGFVIELWHIYNPREQDPASASDRQVHSPESMEAAEKQQRKLPKQGSRYPVLMMHGLLQCSGAFCCNEDKSLAFYLAKSGYDVWLGNNRCGFKPQHTLLSYGDPRMWAWNIRQMGVMDLPALISRVLFETGFEKLGLICHSQGTTQTFVALAKEQRPEIGEKISVFCALAPAVYAGPLISKMYFKFMQVISPSMFRLLFGIHSFIPFMMVMHGIMPRRLYGMLGYHIFSFLFDWSDERWERDLRDRMFQFAPVYVSAESMRWWLGRECFAKQKCILATRAEGQLEEEEDAEEDDYFNLGKHANSDGDMSCHLEGHHHKEHDKFAWYDERAPPMALWVAGNDKLVDGRRLIRRFERGREPFVNIVHHKVIEGYEHLDVIWAMDSIDQVGKEVKEVIWRTAPEDARQRCKTPQGCESASTLQSGVAISRGPWADRLRKSRRTAAERSLS